MDKVGEGTFNLLGETSLGKGCLRAQRYTATVSACFYIKLGYPLSLGLVLSSLPFNQLHLFICIWSPASTTLHVVHGTIALWTMVYLINVDFFQFTDWSEVWAISSPPKWLYSLQWRPCVACQWEWCEPWGYLSMQTGAVVENSVV